MKKIGIVTHFYNSINYGGNLQAYALCKAIEKLGYDAEQIDCVIDKKNNVLAHRKCDIKVYIKKALKTPKKIINKVKKHIHNNEIIKSNLLQKKAISEFNRNIVPHSEKVYNISDINETLNEYSVFITGSDQVWNPVAYNMIYGLEFVPKGVPKFSYAASLAVDSLTESQKAKFNKFLENYIGVSVREPSSVRLIEDISPISPVNSLDPTMLLSREDWDEIAEERSIRNQYVFMCFLGNSKHQKKLVKKFAQSKGLEVVIIPHITGKYNNEDLKYSDKTLYGVSPQKFISLIKHASFVFTDSFHASVFSILYNTPFFVFNRDGKKHMNVRIYDLLEMFDIKERFCDTESKETLEYLLNNIEYKISTEDFEKNKQDSINYLRNTLMKAEKII